MFLSKVEQAYMSGTREFTKAQARCIRYRINKKLKLLDRDAVSEFRDGGPADEPSSSSERKAEDLQPQFFFARSRTTFSRLCKASAFLLQEGALE